MKIDYDQASDRGKFAGIGMLMAVAPGPLHGGVVHQGGLAQGG